MLELTTFYLVTSGSHVAPLIVITLLLKYGLPRTLFENLSDDGPSLKRRLRRIGIARYEQLFQLFNSHIKEYLITFSLIACALQLITMFTIILGLYIDSYVYLLPFDFIPYIYDRWTMDVQYDLFKFWAVTSAIQWLPMICLVFALLYRIPLPFWSALTENREPPTDEIAHGEENSVGFALIHLTRFENSEKTFIYAYCRDDRFGEILKFVLCQGKEAGSRPQCFQYTDDGYFEQIIPAPVSVNLLDEIFIFGNN